MDRDFVACKAVVYNRGRAPDAFLNEMIDWARHAPDDIFSVNDRQDVYTSVLEQLGPWTSPVHRKAVLLEVFRVLGGYESSWDWEEGPDQAAEGVQTACTQEAGIFQCSGDSMEQYPSLRTLMLSAAGTTDCVRFQAITKSDHVFALEYCARLLRLTTNHHGPIKFGHIHQWLSRDSVQEFEGFLV